MAHLPLSFFILFFSYTIIVHALKCNHGHRDKVEPLFCFTKHCISVEFDTSKIHPLARPDFEKGLGIASHIASCDVNHNCLSKEMAGGSKTFTGKEILKFDAARNVGVTAADLDEISHISIEEIIKADRKDKAMMKKVHIAMYRNISLHAHCCSTNFCNTWTLPIRKD